MTVECVDPHAYPGWVTLLGQVLSNIFHSPAWLSLLADTYGWTLLARMLFYERWKSRADLPFCRISDMFSD